MDQYSYPQYGGMYNGGYQGGYQQGYPMGMGGPGMMGGGYRY